MNVDNENIEPVTDLGLALGYSNHSIQRRLNNDFGAGANAASKIDMTCVAADPLSELVWSPQKGLSLRCTDCSFVDKKPSHLWSAGTSNVVHSPPKVFTPERSSNDTPIGEEKFDKSQFAFHGNSKVAIVDPLAKSPPCNPGNKPLSWSSHEQQAEMEDSFPGNRCPVGDTNTKGGALLQHLNKKNDLADSKPNDICSPNNGQVAETYEDMEITSPQFPDELNPDAAPVEPLFKDPVVGARDVGSGTQISPTDIGLASEVQAENECESGELPVKTSSRRKLEELDSLMEKERKLWPPEKMEATAENDLPTLLSRNACVAASKIAGSESACEVEKKFKQDEEIIPDKTFPSQHSPTNSEIKNYRRKGKEKALPDGDIEERMSKEEDDSHESVESCNNTGLFTTGKKRWGFEEQLIMGSKRVKKQIDESPGSSSLVKQDSSFINWISNMMKGFVKSKDETPLALAIKQPNHKYESPDQNPDACSKNQDRGCKNMGFQSIFQSIYCPKARSRGTTLDEDQTGLELANSCNVNATSINCHGEIFNFRKIFLMSNEKFKESSSKSGQGPATQPKVSAVNFSASHDVCEVNSAENQTSCNLANSVEIVGPSSRSFLCKHKGINTENIDSDQPSESKTAHNVGYKSDPLGSLWIARFAPKGSGPLLHQDNTSPNVTRALECSTNCVKFIPCSQNHVNFSSNIKIFEARQQFAEGPVKSPIKVLQNCAIEPEDSVGFNRIKAQNDQNSICKLDSIAPSTRFRNSEAMASLFARRLDALKHIMPADASDNAVSSSATCFFCGRKGHHLKDCSDITDTELEDLLRNVKSYSRMEELPCVCIRCFQLNHWAVACPNASSGGRHQVKCGASLANHNEMQYNEKIGENPKLSDDNENQKSAALYTVCHRSDIMKGTYNYVVTPDKMRSSSSLNKKYVASSSMGNELKQNQIPPFCNFIIQQESDVPKGIFDAIKVLRLSRTDILKWMNSQMPLSNLDGFFLRLRLGKWEEVLGGTGYYVARIIGAQRQSSKENSKYSISVDVGGIKCLVESQYVSNHDFIEDELMAWWGAITRSGGEVPSEEDLRMKVNERRRLRF